jgi:adenine-specific DNA methylase
MNTLYCGDNLHILREHIADESVDLIYLDLPFNSKRVYNVYLKTPKGHASNAQVAAFEDSWTWGEQAEQEFSELLRQPNTDYRLLPYACPTSKLILSHGFRLLSTAGKVLNSCILHRTVRHT